jgi:hypothetical protein
MADSHKMTDFRNRIIESRLVDAADLKPHPLNARRHPENQKRAVAGLLSEVGIVDSLTVYWSDAEASYVILDGHLRKDMGGMWPVNVLDVDDAEALLILSVFDYTASLAELDGAMLADLLAQVEMTPIEDDGVRDLLEQLAGDAGLVPPDDPNEHWQGMPEFEQENVFGAIQSIKVHFANLGDVAAFAKAIGENITRDTKSIWYPKQERVDLMAYQVQDDAA